MVQRRQLMTTSDNECKRVRVSGATRDKEWQRVIQRVTTNSNEWQLVTAVVQPMKTAQYTWMIAFLSMTKTDALLLQGMDGCNYSG